MNTIEVNGKSPPWQKNNRACVTDLDSVKSSSKKGHTYEWMVKDCISPHQSTLPLCLSSRSPTVFSSFVLFVVSIVCISQNSKWIPPWKLNEFRPGSISSHHSERLFSCLLWPREREIERERDLMLLMLLCHCQQFPQNRCKEHKITRAFHQCRYYPSSVSRSCSACHFVCVLNLCTGGR